MRVVAGLGNPGARYASTRHNVGFMVVQEIAKRWSIPLEADGLALRGSAFVAGEPVQLVMPQTYMNRSGEALAGTVESPASENLVVVYDDLDLPLGSLRLRRDGGAGGHRGVESIIEHCGSRFARVRVGIGRPPDGVDAADYVLADVSAADRERMARAVERGASAVECLLVDGMQTAMNRFNGLQPLGA